MKQVIDTSPEVARARLLLFYCAKKVLAEGMTVLGIEPLDRVWLSPQIYISISWSTTFDDEGYLLSLQDKRYNFNSRVRLRGPFCSADVTRPKIVFSSITVWIVCCTSLSLDIVLWLCNSARRSCKYLKLGSLMPGNVLRCLKPKSIESTKKSSPILPWPLGKKSQKIWTILMAFATKRLSPLMALISIHFFTPLFYFCN